MFISTIGCLIFLFFFYQSFSASLQEERKKQAKQLSEIGLGIINHFHRLEISGALPAGKAQAFALNTLQSAVYGDNSYFWLNNGKGILLTQPYTPKMIGSNQIEWADIQGQYIFKEFIRLAKSGGGWIEYHWPKPKKDSEEYLKISYVTSILLLGIGFLEQGSISMT